MDNTCHSWEGCHSWDIPQNTRSLKGQIFVGAGHKVLKVYYHFANALHLVLAAHGMRTLIA